MQRLEQAVVGLEQILTSPHRLQQSWRNMVRQRLGAVCEELTAERAVAADTWLSARANSLHRERNRLIARLSVLGTMVVDSTDPELVRQNLLRLVHDIQRHHQRVNDLAYDAVGMDVGGSE